MTPVLIIMMNHLSQVGHVSQLFAECWTLGNVRWSEVPYDPSKSMVVWIIFRGSILFLLWIHNVFLLAAGWVGHMSLGAGALVLYQWCLRMLPSLTLPERGVLRVVLVWVIAICGSTTVSIHLG